MLAKRRFTLNDIGVQSSRSLAAMLTAVVVALITHCLPATAQQASYEGIEGFVDKKHRNPVLTINPQYFDASTSEAKAAGGAFGRILADAYIPASEYQEYPIRFDFFINRVLVSSQLRSLAQPGAIALTIPHSMAKPPYSYTVIATLVYPNRSFSTQMYGEITGDAATPTPAPEGLSSCSMTLPNSEGGSTSYSASSISGGTVINEETTITFTAVSTSATGVGGSVPTTLTLSIDSETAVGELTTTVNGSNTTTDVSGTVTVSNSKVNALAVTSDSGTTKVSCN